MCKSYTYYSRAFKDIPGLCGASGCTPGHWQCVLPPVCQRGCAEVRGVTATPGHSCLELHASLGVSPCPQQRWALSPCLVGRDGHCRAPTGMRAAVSLVSGWLCGLLTRPGGSAPPPASQSPGSRQGCQPRAGKQRPWEPRSR